MVDDYNLKEKGCCVYGTKLNAIKKLKNGETMQMALDYGVERVMIFKGS